MKMFFFWLILRLGIATSSIIDNEIVGRPRVECLHDSIQFHFRTLKPFQGRVYVRGQSEDPNCSGNFAEGGTSASNLNLRLGACGMQRFRSVLYQSCAFGFSFLMHLNLSKYSGIGLSKN